MSKRITTIPATMNRFSAVPIHEKTKRKVAAYARVSTDNEEQLTSYEAQVDYYTNYIKSRDDWEFVKVYADEGISGCNTKKRIGFRAMIADALAGNINLIITKSVSRFARNTVDSLSTIRKLKENGVECYFEKENIWTFDGKGELLLTIMSSLAQEESRSISENVTWGQRKRFADGKVSVPYSKFLGYEKGADGTMVINEEQAVIVRRIYGFFIKGYSPYAIAKMLTTDGIPTPTGKETWHASCVKSILTNEKYKGDALLQKQFTVNYLTKKVKINEGEIPQYYVEGNHPAIIEPDVFDHVQKLMESRQSGQNRKSSVTIFSSKIKCGDCGGWYGSKVWHSTDQYRKVIWRCNHKFDGKCRCSTPHLDEETIKQLFLKAVNQYCSERNQIIRNFNAMQSELFDTTELETNKRLLQEELNVVAKLIEQCILENSRVALDQDEYEQRYNNLVNRFDTAKSKLAEVEKSITTKQAEHDTMRQCIEELKKLPDIITEFSEEAWCGLVDCITVYAADNIVFRFKDGTEIKAE